MVLNGEVDMPRPHHLFFPTLLAMALSFVSSRAPLDAAESALPHGGPCAFVAIDVAKFGRQSFQSGELFVETFFP